MIDRRYNNILIYEHHTILKLLFCKTKVVGQILSNSLASYTSIKMPL